MCALFLMTLGLAICFATTPAAFADETKLDTKIDSIGLFKNGLAVVDRSAVVNGPGTHRIADVPDPVHGTFFIESAVPVTVRLTSQMVDAPLNLSIAALQDELAKKKVTVRLRGQAAPVTGIVAALRDTNDDPIWSRQYTTPMYGFRNNQFYLNGGATPAPAQSLLMLETDNGKTLIDLSQLSSIEVNGDLKVGKQRRPVLLITVPEGAPAQMGIHINYLTRGMAWAPSYRVELLDDKKLSITQSAALRNELMNLKDVQVFLISGFPSIEFAHVSSPLAPGQTLASFFQQLSQRPGRAAAPMAQQVISNGYNSSSEENDLPVVPTDDAVDIHYESVGKMTLDAGDSAALNVASGQTDYEKLVEWIVPDSRNEYGNYNRSGNDADADDNDTAWDAARFANPLSFAMTTAPAMFTRDGKFLGQQLSRWVNSKETATLRITKALSVRTHAVETESPQDNDRDVVYIGGQRYRKVSVNGELTIKNYRKSPIKMVLKRQFSGDLVSAEEKPKVTLRAEGVWTANRRNELFWTFDLDSAAEKTLKYSYTVLVRF